MRPVRSMSEPICRVFALNEEFWRVTLREASRLGIGNLRHHSIPHIGQNREVGAVDHCAHLFRGDYSCVEGSDDSNEDG